MQKRPAAAFGAAAGLSNAEKRSGFETPPRGKTSAADFESKEKLRLESGGGMCYTEGRGCGGGGKTLLRDSF